MKRLTRQLLITAAVSVLATASAFAQDYPTRPVHVIVPFTAM